MNDDHQVAGLEGLIGEHLDRLANLLEGAGQLPFLHGPVVLPDNKWFPGRWTPDLETVRRLSLRLQAYAGLKDLDAECGLFEEDRHEWLPPLLRTGQSTSHAGAAAFFLGIEGGCAYFGVEAQQLQKPDALLGVMAHEVAHVWRRVNSLEVGDRREEEELTDLTTVALGFGILSANAAYRYEAGGGYTYTEYSHQTTGYLGPDRLASLLAVQCLVRGVDARPVRNCLETTQKAAFDTAMRSLDRDGLLARLGLSDSLPTVEMGLSTPPSIEIRPGRAAKIVATLAERAFEATQGKSDLLDEPQPFELDLIETRHHRLATLGRPHADGGWLVELSLVEDPDRNRSLLVGSNAVCGAWSMQVLGVFDDRFVLEKRGFRSALERLLDPTRRRDLSLVEAPSFIQVHSPKVLDSKDLGAVLSKALVGLGPDQLCADLNDFEDGSKSYSRVRAERRRSPVGPAPRGFDLRKAIKRWWDYASDPTVVEDEYSTWNAINHQLAARH